MSKFFYTFLFLILTFGLTAVSISAQADASNPFSGSRPEEPLPTNIRESLKKQEIERLKKDYDELLENGEQAVKLSEEVEFSFTKNNKLTSGDIEKLDKIEKLLKKIRKELGGDDENEDKVKKPSSIKNAVSTLKESAENLFGELKKTSRYSISVVAIQSSNSLLDIVRYIKFWKK